jgi:CelD/BcsL family acetyltransferase involved in cellulose biosynthesis
VPFCDICGPIMADGAEAQRALADAIAERQKRSGLPLEIHADTPGLRGAVPSQRFLHHEIPLQPDVSGVEARFTRSHVARGARRAVREGLVVERRKDRAALDDFYRLHALTRRHQGTPVQPRRFIRRFTRLFDEGLGHVSVVRDGDRPIAAAVFLTFNRTLTYKYGASDRSHLGKRPNNLLFLDAIRWGCANGMDRLDMGRTDLGNEGLREFKLAWGAREQQLTYTWLANRPPPRDGGPGRLTRDVLRRSPAIVGRAVGEVLYRHFA